MVRAGSIIFLALFGFFVLCDQCHAQRHSRGRFLRASSHGLRIVGAVAFDEGNYTEGSETLSIDLIQGICDEGTDQEEPEAFFDTILGLQIQNSSSSIARLDRFSYMIRRGPNGGKKFKAKKINVASIGLVNAGETVQILVPFLDVQGDRKFVPAADEPIPLDAGFRNVRLKLVGVNALGEKIRITGDTSFSFGAILRCP